jgi:F420-0:gamma-glutamyl ligase
VSTIAPFATVGRSDPTHKRAPFSRDFVAIPVRSPLVGAGDDLAAVVAACVRGIAHPGDVIAVSETAVAIAQNRFVSAPTVRPSRLAYALARRAGALATVNQPESMQLVIDDVGTPRVLFAVVAQIVGRFIGKRGLFYSVLGGTISTIDGYTGTLPPFHQTIVLGPKDPDGAAHAIAAATGAHAVIVDANDLGVAKVLGASERVNRTAVEEALVRNPHGNGDEQTPIVVLAARGGATSPLVRA